MIFTHDMMKPIQLKVERNFSKQGGNERLTSSYLGGKVVLRSENERALIFGKNQMEIALKSGHIREYLGECSPKFPIRPLWVKESRSLDSKSYQRILEYGFNTLMTDVNNINVADLKESGLKAIIPVRVEIDELCFFDEEYQLEIRKVFSQLAPFDYIYWEGTFHNTNAKVHPNAEALLEEEIALFEVQLLESYLPEGVTLIYYLPAIDANRQSEWLLDLCDDVGDRTVIAFSSLAGDPTQDHLTLHPFWDHLRKTLDCCSTPLLPLMNVGSIYLGGGFWPQFPFEHVSEVMSRCTEHNFGGVISLTNQIPGKGSLLDGTLWVTAQMLWRDSTPNQLADTWFLAMRPELDYKKNHRNLEKVRSICCDLSQLNSLRIGEISHEECREIAESIMSQLRQLQSVFSQSSYLDYFTYFSRDASKILLHFLQQQNLPLSSLFRSEELQESFWTEIGEGSKNEVKLLDQPKEGAPGSKMNQIYKEVYGL